MAESKKFIDLDHIHIVGAKEHNLKNIDLEIPRNKMIVITGISGSGKSSLAFDTIYAEGQRRYMETFSHYARQFIGSIERPDVEKIDGLSPVISIEQKTTGWNPRSTVGTITEIYDLFRLMYARAADAYSHATGKKMVRYSEEQMLDLIKDQFQNSSISILAPVVRSRKGHYRELFDQIRKQGFNKVRLDGEITDLKPGLQTDRFKIHDIEVLIDRLQVKPERYDRLTYSIQTALRMGNDVVFIQDQDSDEIIPFSKKLMDPETGLSYDEPSPNSFSFNSPYGACPHCNGIGQVHEADLKKILPSQKLSINESGIAPLGEPRENLTFKQLKQIADRFRFTFSTPISKIPKKALDTILYGGDDSFPAPTDSVWFDGSYHLAAEGLCNMLKRWYSDTSSEKIRQFAEDFMIITDCKQCSGTRLKKESLFFKIDEKHIAELANMDISDLYHWMEGLENRLSPKQAIVAKDVLKEIRARLGFLLYVGLDYLSLNRSAVSLSGGESQRTRLATQIGSQLTGITYILDEPSIGLHQRDNHRLIQSLKELTQIGNTVLVVEHDKDIMMASDYIIDLGPGAGKHGGDLVAQGTPQEFIRLNSITAHYLSGVKKIEIPKQRRKGNGNFLTIYGATGHNLKNLSIKFPLSTFICVTGVSGSGKSSLITETLYPILRQHFYSSIQRPLSYDLVHGLEHLDKVVEIDQDPIGRTPRSNPATYTNVFTEIRNLFTGLPEAKIRGYKAGRFSFNVKGGRCETCEGGGLRVIEMNFLPDVYVHCEACQGKRYNRETLEILYKGKSIGDVLDMTVEEATEFFSHVPNIYRKLKTLQEVGLGYITLGQQATTLSGGEAQRVKLAEELSKKDTGKTFYILDEPTTGLHFEDIQHLIVVLQKLVDRGNTVLVIEHNLDVVKVADYVLDLGPEGGKNGGKVVAFGTPEQLTGVKESYTGQYLKSELR
ncbi:MAG TPA: excinuclease ABC subunit UvrA [Saprospiraceae bacterium]|nr:excinuclease ABC subunit UvrA [Saprospiraceae bacterium]